MEKFLKYFCQKYYLYALLDNEEYYKFYCFSFVENHSTEFAFKMKY